MASSAASGAGTSRWKKAGTDIDITAATAAWTYTAISEGKWYEINGRYVLPDTADDALYIQFGTGATPTWVTSGYRRSSHGAKDDGNHNIGSSTSSSGIVIGTDLTNVVGFSAQEGGSFWLRFHQKAGEYPRVFGVMSFTNHLGQASTAVFHGYSTSTTTVTAIRILFGTQDIAQFQGTLHEERASGW